MSAAGSPSDGATRVPSLFSLSGRVAVVTGAGGGIGRALCRGLSQHGASVAAVDLQAEPLDALVAELSAAGNSAIRIVADLRDADAPARIVGAVDEAFGRLDVLVNNAGVNYKTPLEEAEVAAWAEMFQVNVTACFLLAREALTLQERNGLALSVVNTSSVAASSALGRGNAGFGASKAGLNELTRELAVEWAARNARVNAIEPCQVAGEAFDRLAESEAGRETISRMLAGIPAGRFVEPEELVGPVVFLASDAAAMVTGTVLPVDGGNRVLNPGGTIGAGASG
jgi:NAD(P)-dependent dehydrogenase (short-subunit alcohol dehydrogenase family)